MERMKGSPNHFVTLHCKGGGGFSQRGILDSAKFAWYAKVGIVYIAAEKKTVLGVSCERRLLAQALIGCNQLACTIERMRIEISAAQAKIDRHFKQGSIHNAQVGIATQNAMGKG